MRTRVKYGDNVFDESLRRLTSLYENGHRVIVSFSAGKDSGICLELAVLAAEKTGRLPVEAIIRDEEVMLPSTLEYALRTHARKDVNLHWVVANQPVINIFNRECPYFWVFDPLLKPDEWVRKPPEFTEYIKHKDIEHMVNTKDYPPAPGKDLVSIIGLRVAESQRRKMAIASAKGFLTKKNVAGVRRGNVIYDWEDRDVWRAIKQNKWDYNHAYDIMYRLGAPKSKGSRMSKKMLIAFRIAPPTLVVHAIERLRVASKAYPIWYHRVCKRLPGVRAAVRYGRMVLEPIRRLGETWQECFQRTCIDEAPEWIAERSEKAREVILRYHSHHSTAPFPDASKCGRCAAPASWKDLARMLYNGNPFCIGGQINKCLPYVQPEDFRKGAGEWGGKPTW